MYTVFGTNLIKKMKAIILAAGLGSRLRPITNEIPKCMVAVNGISIIEKQLNNLIENGIKDICVVTGYKGEVLRNLVKYNFPFVKIVDNNRYNETNNMYSLYLCKDFVADDDFLLMNADVFYDANIVTGILQSEQPNMIACEVGCYNEESMKITIDGDNSITHISKQITEREAYATSIDVYKMGNEGRQFLWNKIFHIIKIEGNENSWTEVALDEILPYVKFYPYAIEGRWFEIDTHDDLAQAERLFKD